MASRHVSQSRHIISTHWLRRRARSAQHYYERVQAAAFDPLGPDPMAVIKARELRITDTTQFTVERAKYERAKWVVIGF